jgi:hypothetical protein
MKMAIIPKAIWLLAVILCPIKILCDILHEILLKGYEKDIPPDKMPEKV